MENRYGLIRLFPSEYGWDTPGDKLVNEIEAQIAKNDELTKRVQYLEARLKSGQWCMYCGVSVGECPQCHAILKQASDD